MRQPSQDALLEHGLRAHQARATTLEEIERVARRTFHEAAVGSRCARNLSRRLRTACQAVPCGANAKITLLSRDRSRRSRATTPTAQRSRLAKTLSRDRSRSPRATLPGPIGEEYNLFPFMSACDASRSKMAFETAAEDRVRWAHETRAVHECER